jgi:hypothetical protein
MKLQDKPGAFAVASISSLSSPPLARSNAA